MRLLIVDDDAATRTGLLRHTKWGKYGIDLIQAAASAQEALVMCETFQPDIVLSDIRMRGMTGLEMCAELRRGYPDCQFILISGYSDKEYLMSAIELGVVNYVYKPVNMEKLENALDEAAHRVRDTLRRRSNDAMLSMSMPYLRREALLNLLYGKQDSNTAVSDSLPEAISSAQVLRVGVLRTAAPVVNLYAFQQQLLQHVSGQIGADALQSLHGEFADNRRMLLVWNDESIGVLDALKRFCTLKQQEPRLFLAVGRRVGSLLELPESYRSAVDAEQTLFYLGYGTSGERAGGNAHFTFDEGVYDRFTSALTRDEGEAQAVLQQVRDQLRSVRALLGSQVKAIYFTLIRRIRSQMRMICPDDDESLTARLDAAITQLETMSTLDEIHELLAGEVRRLAQINTQDVRNTSAILQVKRYIQQNYGKPDLSVIDMAEQVYLTPTYLSSLFRQKTGMTIGRFLTLTRMEQAKRLLREKQLKLYNVSQMVGYEDANYFAKAFKKMIGMTPSDYRDLEI